MKVRWNLWKPPQRRSWNAWMFYDELTFSDYSFIACQGALISFMGAFLLAAGVMRSETWYERAISVVGSIAICAVGMAAIAAGVRGQIRLARHDPKTRGALRSFRLFRESRKSGGRKADVNKAPGADDA